MGAKAKRYETALAAARAAPVRPPRQVWDLIVFGFEIQMLRLHMLTLYPSVAGFLVSEASICFQTKRAKPALLTEGIASRTLPSFMVNKTRVRVLDESISQERCTKSNIGRGYSGRCFQAQQRFATLEMVLAVAAVDDLALVSDVDEIAKPEILHKLARCHPYGDASGGTAEAGGAMVMSAHQYKFGVHCDTGYIWHEGPKLYAVRWLRDRQMSDGVWTATSFDNMRRASSYSLATVRRAAWHLTSFGSTDELVRKLSSFGAANLFHAPTALDPERISACTAGCFELLNTDGSPAQCHKNHSRLSARSRMGPRVPRLPGQKLFTLRDADLPGPLLEQRTDFPQTWFQGLPAS